MSNILDDVFAFSHIAFFWGVLAESSTKKNQRYLHVYVPSLTPMRNGDVSDKGSVHTVKLFNIVSQSEEETDVHLSRTIYAEYLGYQSGHDVPDMYKGQQVLVMNYAKSDKWFWIPLERDDYIKTFEHLRMHCADVAMIHKTGTTDEKLERAQDLNDDNTYYFEIDTKFDKKIMFSTASSDGEKYRYFFKIDPTDHTVEIWDNLSSNPSAAHNTIRIESDPTYSGGGMLQGRITLQNEAGSTILLEGPDIKIIAPRDVTITALRDLVMNSQNDTILTVTKNMHINILGNLVKQVIGFIHKEVKGMYTYLFGSTRTEDVVGAYTWNCNAAVVGTAGSMTTTVTAAYVLKANAITENAPNITIMSEANTTVGSAKALTFVAKNIGTSTHIYGCCGCPGH